MKSRLTGLRPQSPPARTRITQDNEKTLALCPHLIDCSSRSQYNVLNSGKPSCNAIGEQRARQSQFILTGHPLYAATHPTRLEIGGTSVPTVATNPSTWARIRLRLRSYVLLPGIKLFDRIWHLLLYILGAILLTNVIFNVVSSVATTGTVGQIDPSTWVVVQQLAAHPTESTTGGGFLLLVVLLAFISHSASHRSASVPPPVLTEMYSLSRVQTVSPTPRFIPQYRPFYLPRLVRDTMDNADEAARHALRSAAHGSASITSTSKYGMCVMGRRMLGSTRLAWEAMKAEREVGMWTLVDWPVDAQQYGRVLDILKTQNTSVVLWLDNLGKYLSSPNARLLNYLPYALNERGLKFAVVATCQEQDYPEVKEVFGELLSHLQIIPLAEITPAESELLALEISKSGTTASPNSQYDGTPGSIVLGVTRMRFAYQHLKDPARQVLAAVKLLRSTGLNDLPTARILRVARDLFAQERDDWTDGLKDLSTAGFVGQRSTVSGDALTLSPAQEVYLAVAVPDYGDAATSPERDWPRLQESLAAARDSRALLRLADAFRAKGGDDHAEQGYRAALMELTEQSAPADWASARLGLAIVLAHRVDEAQGKRADPLLEEAQAAFSDAQRIITQDSAPNLWAEAQSGLAAVVRQTARTTKGRQKRQRMLDEAAANCRAALRILRKETVPDE